MHDNAIEIDENGGLHFIGLHWTKEVTSTNEPGMFFAITTK